MSRSIHLGIDVGGTASRWVACDDDGVVLARGQAPGATGHVFNPAERQKLDGVLMAIAADLAAAGLSARDVAAGLTGFGAIVAPEVKAMIGAALGVASDAIVAVDDMTLAYASIFAPGEGHLVSAGTGSIGLYIDMSGEVVRVGGRGILIDDAGSGSWIALRALDAIYRCFDRTGSFEAVAALARALFDAIGSTDWHGVRQFVYGGDRGRIGALAVAVGAAAEAGDATARQILDEAGRELALLAEALLARAGRHPIGCVGGVLALPLVGDAIRNGLPGHDVRFVSADAALAGARLWLPGGPWSAAMLEHSVVG